MIAFDLQRALKGDALVTGDGVPVTNFGKGVLRGEYLAALPGIKGVVIFDGLGLSHTRGIQLFLSGSDEEWAPEAGDEVEVCAKDGLKWETRVFAFYYNGRPFCAYKAQDLRSASINVCPWHSIRRPSPKLEVKVVVCNEVVRTYEMTKEEIDEKFIL